MKQVDGRVPHGMEAVDVEELAAEAVEAAEGFLIGDDGGPVEYKKDPGVHRKPRPVR